MNRLISNFKTLTVREFQEHRATFIITPLVMIALTIVVMIGTMITLSSMDVSIHISGGDKQSYYDSEIFTDNEIELASFEGEQNATVIFEGLHSGTVKSVEEVSGGKLINALEPEKEFYKLYAIILSIFSIVNGIVLIVYASQSLYADRKDKSILFWKSMPFSEAENVFSKIVTILILCPFVFLVASFVASLCYLILASIYLTVVFGLPLSFIWVNAELISTTFFYSQYTFILLLWLAPVFSWIVYCSALATRSVLLWAIAPPLTIAVLEKVVFDTNYFVQEIAQRIVYRIDGVMHGSDLHISQIIKGYSSVELIIGLILSFVLLAASVWLRNNRYETT